MPSFVLFMDSPIALDHKVGFVAIEVDNVIAKLMLPSEFESKESSIPQQSPKEFFRVGLVLPKLASEGFLSGELEPSAIVTAFFHGDMIIAR